MTARPPPLPRAPWDAPTPSGEVRLLEDEVARLRDALRRPPPPGDDTRHLHDERKALVARVHALEDERLALATRREALRADFDAAARAGQRRDAGLRALGHLTGVALLLAFALAAAHALPAPAVERPDAAGAALLALAAAGLLARVRRRP